MHSHHILFLTLSLAACNTPAQPAPDTTTAPDAEVSDPPPSGDTAQSDDTGAPPTPDQELDCSDGIDNDQDGLLDCEDADCWGATGCTEDCTTPDDEDQDGWAGCGDADCWGTGECPAAEVQVLSADVSHSRRTFNSSSRYRSYADTYAYFWLQFSYIGATESLTFSNVAGVLRVPTTDGSIQTCSWTVGRAAFGLNLFWPAQSAASQDDYFYTMPRVLKARSSVSWDPTCQLSSSHVLPTRLYGSKGHPMQTNGYASDRTFYAFTLEKTPVISSTSRTTTFWNSSSFRHFDSHVFETRTTTIGAGPAQSVDPVE